MNNSQKKGYRLVPKPLSTHHFLALSESPKSLGRGAMAGVGYARASLVVLTMAAATL